MQKQLRKKGFFYGRSRKIILTDAKFQWWKTEGVSEVIIKMTMLRESKQGRAYKGGFLFVCLFLSEEKGVLGRNEGRWHKQ